MNDLYHLPLGSPGEQFVFSRPHEASGKASWQTWVKPPNALMLHIICIGGGGGGGDSNDTGDGCGGGGGGSSAVTRVTLPAFLLPGALFIQIGSGGVGGTANADGASGAESYVSIYPASGAANIIVLSTGGSGGTSGVTAGAGGPGGTIAVIGSMPLAGLGVYNMIAGQNGSDGVTAGSGTSITIPTTSAITQGGSGGGSLAGGTCTAIAGSYLSEQRSTAILAANGAGGVQLWQPFFNFGGLGGGNGGTGGHGAYGAGGGGGGTYGGSDGGNGGDGIVIIEVW